MLLNGEEENEFLICTKRKKWISERKWEGEKNYDNRRRTRSSLLVDAPPFCVNFNLYTTLSLIIFGPFPILCARIQFYCFCFDL